MSVTKSQERWASPAREKVSISPLTVDENRRERERERERVVSGSNMKSTERKCKRKSAHNPICRRGITERFSLSAACLKQFSSCSTEIRAPEPLLYRGGLSAWCIYLIMAFRALIDSGLYFFGQQPLLHDSRLAYVPKRQQSLTG